MTGTEGRNPEVRTVSPNRHRFSAGFTLIEMTIAVLLFALVVGSIYEIWVRGEKSQQVGIELAEASQNARAGSDLIARELRSAGYGVNPAVQPSVVVGSQYRVTFALDLNGNRAIDMGEVITYFLDPSTSNALANTSANPYDYVLRRKVGSSGDSLAAPTAGTGEIVAYGLTQRSSDAVTTKNVPLFSYVNSAGTALELKTGTANDPAGAFFGNAMSSSSCLCCAGVHDAQPWLKRLRHSAFIQPSPFRIQLRMPAFSPSMKSMNCGTPASVALPERASRGIT